MTPKDEVQHLFPVDDIAHRLPNSYVAEGHLVNPHRERSPAPAWLEDNMVAVRYDSSGSGSGQQIDDVRLAAR